MKRRVSLQSFFEPANRTEGQSTVLVVILHGWRAQASRMEDVKAAVQDAFRDGTALDLLVPDLPHGGLFSTARAAQTVKSLLLAVDEIVRTRGPYDQILLVGHSMGATIARRLFLAAVGPVGTFRAETTLRDEAARPWAATVSRIILIAAFNRGWQISERLSWSYSILLNTVGLIGHLMPRRDWTPSVFDIRLGAPFMVQTRLNWLAYRRFSAEDRKRPLLIQLIGSQDDLVSPFDQVDIAVDGLDEDVRADDGRKVVQDVTQRSLYLLHLDHTDHLDSIDFTGSPHPKPDDDKASAAVAALRRAVFLKAVTATREVLSDIAADPDLLSDQVTRPDSQVRRTVFVIHGIRDDGFWTHRIAERVRAAAGDGCSDDDGTRPGTIAFRAWTPTYGYFAMLPFMLPWIRWQKVEWFMDQYVAAAALYPNTTFDYVGHSNGTYLGARALRDYADCRFEHVFFAGSVVRSDYDWGKVVDEKRVDHVLNVVATADTVVALLPKSVEWIPPLDLGGAGFDGFRNPEKLPQLTECRFVVGGHGAGIVEGHWDDIAQFIVNGTPFTPRAAEPPLFGDTQPTWLTWLAKLRITMAFIVVVFAGLPVWALWTHLGWKAGFVFLVYGLIAKFIVTRV